jgi:hypothetical protein
MCFWRNGPETNDVGSKYWLTAVLNTATCATAVVRAQPPLWIELPGHEAEQGPLPVPPSCRALSLRTAILFQFEQRCLARLRERGNQFTTHASDTLINHGSAVGLNAASGPKPAASLRSRDPWRGDHPRHESDSRVCEAATRCVAALLPQEEAFAFHVPLSLPFFTDLWTAGRRRDVPDWSLGDAQLVDLRDNPRVNLDTSFDSLRFYIPQIALDEMANEAGIRRVKGLYAPNFGARDLIMFRLAQALAAAMEQPGDGTVMFCDCIALAFFTHIVRAYGSVSAEGRNARGGLAAWQLQRARDFINANLAGDPSISQVADECGAVSQLLRPCVQASDGHPAPPMAD